MKGIRGTELKPRTCFSRGGLIFSHPSLSLSLNSVLPEVDPPLQQPPPSSSCLSLSRSPSQRTISKWPPLSMALSCCDLTAIKCQIKLMGRHWQGAEAYTTQWIIVMERMMSWLRCARCCSSSLSLREKNILFLYLYVSLMMSRLSFLNVLHKSPADKANKKTKIIKMCLKC